MKTKSSAVLMWTALLFCGFPADAQRLVKTQDYEWADSMDAPAIECSTRRWSYDYIGIGGSGPWFDKHSDLVSVVARTSAGHWTVRDLTEGEDAFSVLASYEDNHEVWLRAERTEADSFVPESVVSELVRQWHAHYPSSVEYGDSGETTVLKPVTAQERNRLARCFNAARRPKGSVVREDFLVSGAPNWPSILAWHDSCELDAPEHPWPNPPSLEAVEKPTPVEWCAVFNARLYTLRGEPIPAWQFLEEGRLPGMCDEDLAADIYNSDLGTGRELRRLWDDEVGEFPGFECPSSSNSTTSTVGDMMFDTKGLRVRRADAEIAEGRSMTPSLPPMNDGKSR